jgi:hypothetical protein
MATVSIPEETFRRLAEKAAALHVSVEELLRPALEALLENGAATQQMQPPLTGEAWKHELEEWKKDAETRAGRYPPGHVLDDSRETIYGEREDSQF